MGKRFPSSEECVERIRKGDPTALVPLIEALEREQDPRAQILERRLEAAMEAAANPPPGVDVSTNVVSCYQMACVFAIRLMQPQAGRIAQAVNKL